MLTMMMINRRPYVQLSTDNIDLDEDKDKDKDDDIDDNDDDDK